MFFAASTIQFNNICIVKTYFSKQNSRKVKRKGTRVTCTAINQNHQFRHFVSIPFA